MRTETLQLGFCPHRGQRLIAASKARIRIGITGRQWGKTKYGANETVRMSVEAGENSVGCVGAPTYWHLMKCWNEILSSLGTDYKRLVVEVHKADHSVELVGHRLLYFRSADEPSGFRSQHWNFAWLDEVQLMQEEAWFSLEPALFGPALLTGTPFGLNWVYRMFLRGQDRDEIAAGRVESWNFPTSDNPYYPAEKIEDARLHTPRLWFEQEYLGMFKEDIGAFFRGVDDHILLDADRKRLTECSGPVVGESYVVGCDLAKSVDYTVLVALDGVGHVCGFDRFHQLDWPFQRDRIARFVKSFNDARLCIDATGMGDPNVSELRKEDLFIEPYKISGNAPKANLVENLSLMMDDGRISYPEIPDLLNELRVFGYELDDESKLKKYRAPSGFHDDCVIALALAAWLQRSTHGPIGVGRTRRSL